MKRLLLCIGAVLMGALGSGTLAFAGGQAPMVTPTEATFVVGPHNPSGTRWTLNLWFKGNLVGTDSGTAGTLTVAVPARPSCKFQADVQRDGKWYSGNDANFTSCGGNTTTTTTTTIVTSAKGGKKPKGGHKSSTDPSPAATSSKDPSTKAAGATKSPTLVSSSKLAFTGVGAGLWILALAGSGLVLIGMSLVVRRSTLRR